MNAGNLKHRINIEELSTTQNGVGQQLDSWQFVASTWASIKPLQADESIDSQTEIEQVTHEVIIRYRTDIKANMRLVYGTRILNVVSAPININEQGRFVKVICYEVS